MRPLHFLLVHSGLSPAALASRVHQLGLQYGSTSKQLTGNDVSRWSRGEGRVPSWAHRAAFELAIDAGWPIQSSEDCRIAVRTFREIEPGANIQEFRRRYAANLKDPPDLASAWAVDVAKHPYARMTAAEFDATIAHFPARGPTPSRQLEYARRVLVQGMRASDVAAEANVRRQAVSRAATKIWKRFRGEST